MKTVALFGGSFNPPHPGHFEMGRHIYESLNVDEVWFLFSENRFKDPDAYASCDHRMAMAELLCDDYPNYPFVMSDIQDRLGTHITHEVLEALSEQNPDTRFVWVMGADNLIEFHKWEQWREIMESVSIGVLARPGDRTAARHSPAATAYRYAQLRGRDSRLLAKSRPPCWCFVNVPMVNLSSSEIRARGDWVR